MRNYISASVLVLAVAATTAALSFHYWKLTSSHGRASLGLSEACDMIKPGISVNDAIFLIEDKSFTTDEFLDGNQAGFFNLESGCVLEIEDGRVKTARRSWPPVSR